MIHNLSLSCPVKVPQVLPGLGALHTQDLLLLNQGHKEFQGEITINEHVAHYHAKYNAMSPAKYIQMVGQLSCALILSRIFANICITQRTFQNVLWWKNGYHNA